MCEGKVVLILKPCANLSIWFQVVVTHKKYKKQYVLSPSRGNIAKALGRQSNKAFARHAYDSLTLRKHLVSKFSKLVGCEVRSLCHDSPLQNKDVASLSSYTWDSLYASTIEKAPILGNMLNACIPQKSHRKCIIFLTCVAVLMNSHRCSTLIQAMVSVILYSGHAAKQVIQSHFACTCT